MFLSKLGQNLVKSGGVLANTCNGVAGIASSRSKYTLPDLPYDYNALEPVISGEIMKLHHQKHHATYVQNLNAAEEKIQTALQKGDLKTAIEQQKALKFNGGGHINHSIFWKNLGPAKDCSQKQPEGDLAAAIKRDFGDVESLKKRLSDKAVAVQGSGWAWLGYCPKSKRLGIAECANQDPLEATMGLIPLFGIDVWEHAYYLQYKNVRADYVKEIWKIVNWSDVAERFGQAASSK